MLKTELLGDPDACRQTGVWLNQVSAGLFDAATTLEVARMRLRECWCGSVASAFEEHVGRGREEADQLSVEIERVAFALLAFADRLDTVAAQLRQARAAAVAAGLTVTAQTIEPPGMVRTDRLRAWQEVHQAVSDARDLELAAHQDLATVVTASRQALDSLRGSAGFLTIIGAAGLAEGLPQQNSEYHMLARRYARESRKLTHTSLFALTGRVLGRVPYPGVRAAVDPPMICTGVGTGAAAGLLMAADLLMAVPLALVDGSCTPAAVGVSAAAARGVGYAVGE